jgi:hypothetical protein
LTDTSNSFTGNKLPTFYLLSDIAGSDYRFAPVLPARFFAKITYQSNGCWLWTGSRWGHPRFKCHAYGQIRVGDKRISAHVFAYKTVKGAIPDGCEIDHTCQTKLCVNPQHLEAVTHAENMRRIRTRAVKP